MYRKLFTVLLLCFLFSSGRLQAQTTEGKSAQYAISLEPKFMNGGFGLNLEKKIRPNHWIELNLMRYYLPHENREKAIYPYIGWYGGNGYSFPNADYGYISGVSGLGIGTTYKYYFSRNYLINTALSYTWYNVKYSDYAFYPYTENGLTFYDYKWLDTHQPFHKLRLQVAIGARSKFERALFAEPYVGIGCSYSFYNENKNAFNETIFGYGHRGLYLLTGIKLGFNLQKM